MSRAVGPSSFECDTEAIAGAVEGDVRDTALMEAAMAAILSGEASPVQIAAFAVGLRMRGEKAEEPSARDRRWGQGASAVRRCLLAAVLCAACSSDEPRPGAIEVEPREPARPEAVAPVQVEPPAPSPEAPTTRAEEPLPDPPGPVRVVDLSRARGLAIPQLRTTRRYVRYVLPPYLVDPGDPAIVSHDPEGDPTIQIPYGLVDHPQTTVREALVAWMDSALERCFAGDDVLERRGCRTTLAHARLYSQLCACRIGYARDGIMVIGSEVTFAIDENGGIEVAHTDAMLAPGLDLTARLRRICEDARGADCEWAIETPTLSPGPRGLVGLIGGDRYTNFVIPWRDLDRSILADSPLGLVLREQEGVGVVEIEPPRTTGALREGLVVLPARPLAEAVEWGTLPPERRPDLVFAAASQYASPYGDGPFVTIAPFGRGFADEAAARAAHGAHLGAFRWQVALEPALLRTIDDAVVRNEPRRDARLAVPRGTLLVGVRGNAPEQSTGGWARHPRTGNSSWGERGSWTYVAANRRFQGWVAGNLLVEHEGCVPAPDRFVDGLSEDDRRLALGTLIRSVTQLGGRRVVAFASLSAPADGGRSGRTRLAIHDLGDECAVGDARGSVEVSGALDALAFVRVRPGAQERLIVLATKTMHRIGPRLLLNVYRPDLGRPLLTRRSEHASVETAVGEGDDYRIAVVGDAALRWTGSSVEVLERAAR